MQGASDPGCNVRVSQTMHDWPEDVRLQLVGASAVVWGTNFLILTARSILDSGSDWLLLVPARLAITGLGLVLCFFMHLVLRRLGQSLRNQVVASLMMLPLVTEVYAWASVLLAYWLFDMPIGAFDGEALLQLATILWLFATWTGFYLCITFGSRLREQERRAHAERLLAKTAQLQALRYQVNPHFLFNTLNSVSALIADNRRVAAERMLESLCRFLRTTLRANDDEDVSLAEELALQRAYLEVEQARFPDLELAINLPDEVAGALVPSLILQPLVENAIKHGVATRPGRNTIIINAGCHDGVVRVKVSNDTAGKVAESGAGIGLANVERRLAARYGAAARLSTSLTVDCVFESEIELPLRRAG